MEDIDFPDPLDGLADLLGNLLGDLLGEALDLLADDPLDLELTDLVDFARFYLRGDGLAD